MPLEIKVGDVWVEKTTGRPFCIISINPRLKAAFLSGLDPQHSVASFEDIRKNADKMEGWSPSRLFEGFKTS